MPENPRSLALRLLHADLEEDVIAILKEAGYWDNPDVWRLYGDKEGNFASAGNQQSKPEAALVEKLVNAVDARLLNKCLKCGVNPESDKAPRSIREGVARFFGEQEGRVGGHVREWSRQKRKEEAKAITLAATGKRGRKRASLTVVDRGEGQTPKRVPETILSLNKSNKQRIKFVQGKFNMGGTGALRFCGKHCFQLVITKRNPTLLNGKGTKEDSDWGVTIVRREEPSGDAGTVLSSEFTYLAPLGADSEPRRGEILHFPATTLALMPEKNEPYKRKVSWGTAIKLYEYELKTGGGATASNILRKDGLLYRLEVLLPEIALPVRLYECGAGFGGKEERSYETNLAGLVVRLEDGKGDNLEPGFPDSVNFSVDGHGFVARIYAFKKGKAATYLRNEGIIFAINGQTHGNIPRTFFGRKKVGKARIAKDLFVIVDCSDMPVVAREDLFMSSRDRLSNGELRQALERQLEEVIGRHPALKSLQDQRREAEVNERLEDSKPLEDVLKNILKNSPSLEALFLKGQRLGRAHSPKDEGASKTSGGKGRNGSGTGSQGEFRGKIHPTYFHFRNKKYGVVLTRNCEQGRRVRIAFETDVENEYFSRAENPGRFSIEDKNWDGSETYAMNPHNGVANLSLELPDDIVVGGQLKFCCVVNDDTLVDPFRNEVILTVCEASETKRGRSKEKERGGGEESEKGAVPGLSMPVIEKVKESAWKDYDFDERSACSVIPDEVGGEEQLTFYVNVDNTFLRNDMKRLREDPKLIEAKFIYGNVLMGLALLQEERVPGKKDRRNGNGDGADVYSWITKTTQATAPFIVPMIDYLGGLRSEDLSDLGEAGDDD